MLGPVISEQTDLASAGIVVPLPGLPSPLADMLRDVACAVATPIGVRDRNVAAALAPYIGRADLLDGMACPTEPENYARHLLYEGEGYSVVALVWRPRQMSPVHGHRTWCVFGIHHGWMTETLFTTDDSDVRPIACVPRCAGDMVHAPAGSDRVHRLANLGTMDALSIHVYGASYDRLGLDVNIIRGA